MQTSIFYACVKAFLVSLFVVLGIFCAFIPIGILMSSLSSGSSLEKETIYSKEIVPNANGIRKEMPKDTPVVLKINIHGIIGTEDLDTSSMRQLLVESREGDLKDRVKAILLTINTPGGTVVDADGIYRVLKEYKENYKIPIYAYVDGLCASGGMYIACAADKIYSSNVSLIGSVGVVSPMFLNIYDLIDKWGIKSLTLTAGKDKDVLNPLRPWKSGEQDMIQDLINYYYNRFVDIVSTNRPNLNKDKLIKDYGAKIFDPIQAAEYGYVNASGFTYETALKELLKAISVENDQYQVVELKHSTWYSHLFNSKDSILKGKVTYELKLPSELDPKIMNQFLYLYRP